MEDVIQAFDSLVRDKKRNAYRVFVVGRSRWRNTWQGWLTFVRDGDGRSFETPIETTQPNREALVYWATGLTDAYLEGALTRALAPVTPAPRRMRRAPIVDRGVDALDHQFRREEIERDILALFTAVKTSRYLASDLFDALPHGSADIVRALEHLERNERMLTRRTEEGNDWIFLTPEGVRATTVAAHAEMRPED